MSNDTGFITFLETRNELIKQRREAFEANKFYTGYTSTFQYKTVEFDGAGSKYFTHILGYRQ